VWELGTPFPHKIKRKTAPYSSNTVSIHLSYKNFTLDLPVSVEKGMGTRSHAKKDVGMPFPPHFTLGYTTGYNISYLYTVSCPYSTATGYELVA